MILRKSDLTLMSIIPLPYSFSLVSLISAL